MIDAIVLAAGASARMGSAKAVLRAPDDRPFVTRILDTLVEAGLARLVVVTGVHHASIEEACGRRAGPGEVRCIRNPDPSRGQLSSLLTGMDALVTPDTEGLLVTLVDVPMVTVRTVQAVVNAWRTTHAPVVRPAMGDRHGHPVVFDRSLFGALRAAPLETGAKTVVRAHAARIVNVPVDDPGCLDDVDTPDDYARLGAG